MDDRFDPELVLVPVDEVDDYFEGRPSSTAKLLNGILLARDSNVPAEDDYRSFWMFSQNRLRGLVSAFFTKLIHFSAGANNIRELRHLILDQKVAAANGCPKKTSWNPSGYGDYPRPVNELLQGIPEVERADCIEMQLIRR